MTAFVVFIIVLCSLGGVIEGIAAGNTQSIAICSVFFLAAAFPVILHKRTRHA